MHFTLPVCRLASAKAAVSAALVATTLFAVQAAHAQQYAKLNMLWEVRVNGTDYMTSTSATERDLYTSRGAVVYLPATNLAGTAAFNRLYNGTFDHMDSVHTAEGPYFFDTTLGYAWTSPTAAAGLTEISRAYNNTVEHVTFVNGDAIPGYTTQENFGRYGYRRFNNVAEVLNPLTAGGVTIKSNSVAGGSLWSWVWNGIEFVDHQDYGREMQSAIFYRDPDGTLHNPTEAGAQYSFPNVQPGNRQGSPVLNNQNSGSTQITRAIPLDFDPVPFGGDNSHPIIYYQMQIGKDITLNYNGMGPVAQYVTQVYTASPIPAQIEIPTGYMPATFNRYYTYDAQTQTLTEITLGASVCDGSGSGSLYIPPSGYGGVIISNANQTAAMAVYGRLTSVSGDVTDFTLFDLRACGATSKWNAHRSVNLPAGSSSFKTWVASGTLSSVVTNMRQLYLNGAS